MVKTPHFQCRDSGSIPGQGTKISHALQSSPPKNFYHVKLIQKNFFLILRVTLIFYFLQIYAKQYHFNVVAVQLLSCVRLFATPGTAACQASLSFTISLSLLKLISTELVISSNHLILCHSLLLLPSTFPNIRVFSIWYQYKYESGGAFQLFQR